MELIEIILLFGIGYVLGMVVGLMLSGSFDRYVLNKKTEIPDEDGVPQFQKNLIALSQIPGLKIEGRGIKIEGLKLDDKE